MTQGRWCLTILACWIVGWTPAAAQSVQLEERDATVWSHEQVVRGEAVDTEADGTLYVNDRAVAFTADGAFEVPVRLGEGENVLVACAPAGGEAVCSDTLRWTLGYALRPELYTYATVDGRSVTLHGDLLANPDSAALTFAWHADPDNPATLGLTVVSDTTATLSVPAGAPAGEYYFDWAAAADDGDEGRARTFITVDATGVTAFDITSDHAAWVDRAMIYEVTPYIFHEDGGLADVTARLPELEELGVNTIWVQPIFGTANGGQGYDITNYFVVRPDYGTAADLQELVEAAHARGMKVLLDFVPNHTSVEHPYAQHAADHGAASPYYDFYLREEDEAAYSQYYNHRTIGEMDFLYYFWEDLLIIDYSNPEVQRWMMEAGRYWIEQFDIDGYRIDAVWGVNARTPAAMQQWRFDLKRRKPEVLLLGEDKATWPASFDQRFDVAYDWFPEQSWVSHWTWQVDYVEEGSKTIFNTTSENSRAEALRDALTNRGNGFHPDAKVLRFMENNDISRFIADHSLAQTKMAATLLFSLPGVPLIYNGQEAGRKLHPYETFYVYFPWRTIRDQDAYGLFPHYQHLLRLRKAFPALYSDTFAEVDVSPGTVAGQTFAYRRWAGDEQVVGVINMGDDDVEATLALSPGEIGLEASETYYLTDLFTGDHLEVTGAALASLALDVPAYTTRLYVLADEIAQVPTAAEPTAPEVPAELVLAPNYPNPFNPTTTLAYELPAPARVRLAVYDVLGREVALLVDREVAAGRHEAVFDARGLASGLYFYRLETPQRTLTRSMLLTK